LQGIDPLLDRYDGWLVDQYGVLHDGVRVRPGALLALELLAQRGRRVVLLSNSGKRARDNEVRLTRLGVPRALYAHCVTSGEVAWELLREGSAAEVAGLGNACVLLARDGDLAAVEGLALRVAAQAAAADFVLLAGLDPDDGARATARLVLDQALARGLPLLCTNPDRKSLEGDRQIDGPGAFAERYAAAGGAVRFVGKPWPAIYRRALALLGSPRDRTLAVGDSLHHDVLGASRCGLATALVLDGVHREAFAGAGPRALAAALEQLAAGTEARPDWLLPTFRPGHA
jgi:HAD superfamily hydrolase (TIGR01459 family)